jgi:sugar/nucleoside kinase (ribokinase family)
MHEFDRLCRSVLSIHELDRALDVVVSGLVFHDLVFGLPTPPRPGTEVWATDSQESPGGIANFAVALARLGLRTGLAAAFGADETGDGVWDRLSDEGIDLTLSRKLAAGRPR